MIVEYRGYRILFKIVLSLFLTIFFLLFGCSPTEPEQKDIDKIKPEITLKGDNPMTIEINKSYNEPGATATDNIEGNITSKIQITSTVDTSIVGTYSTIYVVSDKDGNTTTAYRTVKVTEKDIQIILPELGIEYNYYDSLYVVVKYNLNKVSDPGWNYSTDNGKTWKAMYIFFKRDDNQTYGDPFGYDVFKWVPENDSLKNIEIHIKVHSYDNESIFDIIGPIKIN